MHSCPVPSAPCIMRYKQDYYGFPHSDECHKFRLKKQTCSFANFSDIHHEKISSPINICVNTNAHSAFCLSGLNGGTDGRITCHEWPQGISREGRTQSSPGLPLFLPVCHSICQTSEAGPDSDARLHVFGSDHRIMHFYIPNSSPVSIFVSPCSTCSMSTRSNMLWGLLPEFTSTKMHCSILQSISTHIHTAPRIQYPLHTHTHRHIPTSRDSCRVTSVCVRPGPH